MIFLVYLLSIFLSVFAERHCDNKTYEKYPEGNIGQVGAFPWIGVLRVHIHEDNSMKVAVTGLLMIKHRFAIAMADDVTKVAHKYLREDTKAMFVTNNYKPENFKVVDYTTHPEFGYSSGATLTLVELDMNQQHRFPPAICWPPYSFNASDELYVIGYTDEKMLLEKIMYKMQYVDQNLCSEFYNRVGFKDTASDASQYHCGFAKHNVKHCDFENGMVLATNASGFWHLIGFSIHGPGCSAPARFLDLLQHKYWVDIVTDRDYTFQSDSEEKILFAPP